MVSKISKPASSSYSLHSPNNPFSPAETSWVDTNRPFWNLTSRGVMPASIFWTYRAVKSRILVSVDRLKP